MDPADRLARYLANELTPDETRLVEADLARNPTLRAQLDASQHADAALAVLQPASPPDGFESRLRRRLDTELAQMLPSAGLLERLRKRFASMQLVPTLAAAAAGLAAIGGIGLVASSYLSGDDPEMHAADSAEATQDQMGTLAMPDVAQLRAPSIVAANRTLDGDTIADVLALPELTALADEASDPAVAAQLAVEFRAALEDTADPPGQHADAPSAMAPPAPESDTARSLDADNTVDVRAALQCFDTIVSGTGPEPSPTPILAYIELAHAADGSDVFIYGLIISSDESALAAPQAWVADVSTCELIAQHG